MKRVPRKRNERISWRQTWWSCGTCWSHSTYGERLKREPSRKVRYMVNSPSAPPSLTYSEVFQGYSLGIWLHSKTKGRKQQRNFGGNKFSDSTRNEVVGRKRRGRPVSAIPLVLDAPTTEQRQTYHCYRRSKRGNCTTISPHKRIGWQETATKRGCWLEESGETQ